jgi:hypothetical protein
VRKSIPLSSPKHWHITDHSWIDKTSWKIIPKSNSPDTASWGDGFMTPMKDPQRKRKPTGNSRDSGIRVDGLRPAVTFFVLFGVLSGLIWGFGDERSHKELIILAGVAALLASVTTRCTMYVHNTKSGKRSATWVQRILFIPIYQSRREITKYNELVYREEFDLAGLLLYIIGCIVLLVIFFPLFGMVLLAIFPVALASSIAFHVMSAVFESQSASSDGVRQGSKFSVRLAGKERTPIRLCRLASQNRVNALLKYMRAKAGDTFTARSMGGSW